MKSLFAGTRSPLCSTSHRAPASWSLGLLLAALLPTGATAASPPAVVINEVLYDAPSTDTGKEWIELYNAGSDPAEVAGWTIERGGASFDAVFTFPAGTTIAPHGLILVGESAVIGAQYTATLAFQNGGDATDGIRLVDADGMVVDVLLYDQPNTNALPDETGSPGTSFATDASEGRSLARIPDGADTNASGADFQSSAAPTPGQPNSGSPSPTPSPSASPTPTAPPGVSGVVVNEALPDPVGGDTEGEFIELWNSTGQTVDLSGAKIDDEEGGSAPYLIPNGIMLASGSYRGFLYHETKVTLNNDGDTVRLLAPDGQVTHSLTYPKSPREGAAWARRGDGSAEWTMTPTRGTANVFTPVPTATPTAGSGATTSPTLRAPTLTPQSLKASPSGVVKGATGAPRVPLADVRTLPLGSRVRSEGVISVPPGPVGENVLYLAGSGLRVFLRGSPPPTLALGDRVQVEGVVSSSHNERQLKVEVSFVQKIGAGSPPAPTAISTGSVNEAAEGALVRIQGRIVRISGNRFLVDDGTGETRVVIHPHAGWKRPTVHRGTNVTVVGVVSQYDDHYRVLPRFPSDLLVGGGGDRGPETGSGVARGPGLAEDAAEESLMGLSNTDATASPTTSSGAATSPPGGRSTRGRVGTATILLWSTAGVLGALRLFVRRG